MFSARWRWAAARARCRWPLRGWRPSPPAVFLAGSWCPVPRCSVSAAAPTSSCAAGRSGEVSAPGLTVLLGRARLAAPRGVAEHHHLQFFQHTEAGAGSKQHPATTLRSLPQKGKHPGNPVQARCHRCRAAPGLAGGSCGDRRRPPCLPGRTAASATSAACPPCAGGCGPVRNRLAATMSIWLDGGSPVIRK